MKEDNLNMDELDERIERFLKDEMTPSESEAFTTEIQSNPKLAERAKAMALLIKSIKHVGSEQDAKIKESVINPSKTKSRVFKLYSGLVALAASLLLMLGITDFFIARQRTMDLAISYADLAPQLEVGSGAFKGSESDSLVVAELDKAFNDIKQNVDVDESIDRLSTLFALACSDKLNQYTEYADCIGYNLAIALLKDNNREEACKVLKQLLIIYPNYEDAKNLLIEINQVKGLW